MEGAELHGMFFKKHGAGLTVKSHKDTQNCTLGCDVQGSVKEKAEGEGGQYFLNSRRIPPKHHHHTTTSPLRSSVPCPWYWPSCILYEYDSIPSAVSVLFCPHLRCLSFEGDSSTCLVILLVAHCWCAPRHPTGIPMNTCTEGEYTSVPTHIGC